ncbi:MAG: stage III sporulation protein AB [Clostridia bacterium]|nr:stage III sporulation protein AB [Clostridia bacterium]
MLKIFGAAAVFLPCFITGLVKSYRLKKRCDSLASLKLSAERIGAEISFTKKRLERIFSEISRDFNLPVFYDTAMSVQSMGLKSAWTASITKYSDSMALTEQDIKALETLGELGSYTGDEQQRCIRTAAKLLELSHTEALDVYSRTGKLCRSSGTLFGILAVILLI